MNYLDLSFFARQLQLAVGSGVGAAEAVRDLSDVTANADLKSELSSVASELERGVPLSEAVGQNARFAQPFSAFAALGELSGKLSESMGYAAAYFSSAYQFKRQTSGGLIYPIAIFMLAVPLLAIQLTVGLWESLSTVANITSARTGWLWSANVAILALFVLMVVLFFAPGGARRSHLMTLWIPAAHRMVVDAVMEHLSRMAGLLVRAGMPIHQALKTASDALGTHALSAAMDHVFHNTQHGVDLRDSLNQSTLPSFFTHLLVAGMARGEAGSTLEDLSAHYQQVNVARRRVFTTVVQPLALTITAIAILLFILNFEVAPIALLREALK